MLIVFIAFIIFLIVGMPVAFAVGISGALFFVQHSNLPATIMVQMPLTQAQNFALLAVPLFIFAGNLLNCGGTTDRLAKFAGILTGRMRGGYAQTSVVLSTMMGGVSGSAIADAAMEARLLGGDMKKAGYSKGFIACNIAFTGLITATVPPGNAMIIYGTTGNVSIGKLFTTGLVVGLFMMLVMMFTTWMIAAIRGYKPARTEKAKPREVWEAFKECFWALLFPVILLVGIRTGLFTPSEVGAFACVYAAFVGVFIYKELNWKTFVQALGDTTRDVGAVMFIIALSALFGYGVPIDKVPQKVAEIMLGITSNPHLVLVMIILMLTVVGDQIHRNRSRSFRHDYLHGGDDGQLHAAGWTVDVYGELHHRLLAWRVYQRDDSVAGNVPDCHGNPCVLPGAVHVAAKRAVLSLRG